MCGIVGISAKQPANQLIFDALTALQHRGQDAAGMVTCEGQQIHSCKGNGLVRDVIHTRHMVRLQGELGIGHVRYPTAGSDSELEAQPFYVNSPFGIVLAHNGNLTNAEKLTEELRRKDKRHLMTSSDSEILLNILASELQRGDSEQLNPKTIFTAVKNVFRRCEGAYAAVAIIHGFGMLAFRDPNGIRPIVYGNRQTEEGLEHMVASENVALDSLDFENAGDLAPGEAIFIDNDGNVHRQICASKTAHHPCLFEYVYLARPDSVIDKISVYKVRLRLGERLAEKIQQDWNGDEIDVVMPIPDTSRTAASTLARVLGVKFREGYVKNRYIGRTFIMPGQQMRRKSVRRKLNTIDLEFKDKNVLLVDDSIVRGTTAREIIQMARDAGAKKVFFASAAPEVRFPNVYGIDMPAADELIASDKTVEEVAKAIGADKLIFQNLEALVSAAQEGNPDIKRFEDCVFTGDYITGGIDKDYFKKLAHKRADKNKKQTV